MPAYGEVIVDFGPRFEQAGLDPSDIGSVVGNLTVTQPGSYGFATVYPTGRARPNASNLNFHPNQTIPNLTTVMVGQGNSITIANLSPAPAHYIYDLFGYYEAGNVTDSGMFTPLEPARILYTRVANGATGPVGAFQEISLQVAGRGSVPTNGASAVVLNVTATNTRAPGFITVWPSGVIRPTASNINFVPGDSLPNMVTVPIGSDGRIRLANWSNGTVDLIADVAGYYRAGEPLASGSFVPITPTRVLDTRIAFGDGLELVTSNFSVSTYGPVPGNGGYAAFNLQGVAGVQSNGGIAYLLNSTVTAAQAPGFITAERFLGSNWSNLNFERDQTIANATVMPGGAFGSYEDPQSIYQNYAAGSVHMIADIAGYFRW